MTWPPKPRSVEEIEADYAQKRADGHRFSIPDRYTVECTRNLLGCKTYHLYDHVEGHFLPKLTSRDPYKPEEARRGLALLWMYERHDYLDQLHRRNCDL
jgi:hypothetical protein